MINEVTVTIALPILLIGSLVLGRQFGRARDEDLPHLGVIQGATLGLLGLLIGFSFAGASERFVARQDILTREANAMGTAWMRADLLPEASRAALKDELRSYAKRRIALFESQSEQEEDRILDELFEQQKSIWRLAVSGVANQAPLAGVVLPPLNEMFDLLGLRNAATRRHLPVEVLTVLVACAMLSAATISFGQARQSVPVQMPAIGLVVLITAIIWLTIDLDFPRRGLVRMSDAPLRELMEAMEG